MSQRLVFAHGMGRDGAAAWPAQVEAFPDAVYLSRPADDAADTVDAAALAIRNAAPLAAVVVAHSYGAAATARALAEDEAHRSAAVLLEPALHRLARGADAVERHVARVDAVFARTDAPLELFWRELVEAISGSAFEGSLDDDTLRTAARFRRLGPPWRHEIDADAFVGRPTLVVTGGWNDEYEQIASHLERGGARHVMLTGHGHRPQDHPEFNALLVEFVTGIEVPG